MLTTLTRSPWRRWWLGLVVLALVFIVMPPAPASVHTYRERPGQITLRSQQSLRDSGDQAWQAVVFKRWQQGQVQGTYLRLVGFPGGVAIAGNQPLAVLAATGQQWSLAPRLDPQTAVLPENAAQYDLTPLLQDLHQPLPLAIQVPLRAHPPVTLTLAPFVVGEWLQLKHPAIAAP